MLKFTHASTKFQIRIEAAYLNNIEGARTLVDEMSKAGFGNQANFWLAIAEFEKIFGDAESLRKARLIVFFFVFFGQRLLLFCSFFQIIPHLLSSYSSSSTASS